MCGVFKLKFIHLQECYLKYNIYRDFHFYDQKSCDFCIIQNQAKQAIANLKEKGNAQKVTSNTDNKEFSTSLLASLVGDNNELL